MLINSATLTDKSTNFHKMLTMLDTIEDGLNNARTDIIECHTAMVMAAQCNSYENDKRAIITELNLLEILDKCEEVRDAMNAAMDDIEGWVEKMDEIE